MRAEVAYRCGGKDGVCILKSCGMNQVVLGKVHQELTVRGPYKLPLGCSALDLLLLPLSQPSTSPQPRRSPMSSDPDQTILLGNDM